MTRASTDSLAPGWAARIASSVSWTPPLVPTLIVVPHPDDESLSTGGLIARLRRHDVPVVVIGVTDGDAAYPELVDRPLLAAWRRREQQNALHALDVRSADVRRAGIGDGTVEAHVDVLRTMIERVAEEESIGHIVAPWVHDHHCDHEATGRAARDAARRLDIPLTYGLFWGLTRTDAPSGGTGELRRLDLSDDERRRKRVAIEAHRTQITTSVASRPVLDDDDLAPTRWSFELFLGERAP